MIPLLLALANPCIQNDVTNINERECFFGTYERFEELASIAADVAGCPTDCSLDCGPINLETFSCLTVGVLANYREACGSSYYANKVMPRVYAACGILGTTLQNSDIAACTDMDGFIFNVRQPACHNSNAPSPETASFSVFYTLLTVRRAHLHARARQLIPSAGGPLHRHRLKDGRQVWWQVHK
jgi:hypothetical protein